MKRQLRNTLEALSGVEITGRDEVTVAIMDSHREGRADFEETEKLAEKVTELTGWGGYRTGWGAWVLSKGYKSCSHDYCNPASARHY